MGFETDGADADNDLNRSLQELGEPDALFRVSRVRFVAKLVIGVTLVVGGLIANYFYWVEGPGARALDHYVFLFLIGLPVYGGLLLWHMYQQRGLVILIYPTGLLRLCRGQIDSFPWTEIDHLRLKVQKGKAAEIVRDLDGTLVTSWLPIEVPTFKLWKSGIHIAREDGVETRLSAAMTDFGLLAEEVQKRTFAVLWPRTWNRFLAGMPLAFGDLELSLRGVRHGGKLIRWTDLKEATVFQGMLRIKQGGKWFPSLTVDAFSIPNLHVFFALVKEAQRAAVR